MWRVTIFTALAYFAHSTIPKENREFLVVYPYTRQDNNAKTQNLHLLRQQLIYRLVVVFVNFLHQILSCLKKMTKLTNEKRFRNKTRNIQQPIMFVQWTRIRKF